MPAILSEIKRVLKPGGRYLFLEHGRSVTEKGRKLQRRLNPLNKLIIGCRLDAPIRTLLEEAAFRFERIEEFMSEGGRLSFKCTEVSLCATDRRVKPHLEIR